MKRAREAAKLPAHFKPRVPALSMQASPGTAQALQLLSNLSAGSPAVARLARLQSMADSGPRAMRGDGGAAHSGPSRFRTTRHEPPLQQVPTRNAGGLWVDTDVDATTHASFHALAQAHIATYRGYTGNNLKALFPLFRKHLTPGEIRDLIDTDDFKSAVVDEDVTLNVRTIRMPGVAQNRVDSAIQGAGAILGKFNITINVASTVVVSQQQLGGGITGVDGRGRFAQGTSGQDQWALIGRYMNGNELPLLFVPDVTGFGFLSKPNGVTLELARMGQSRTMVVMRSGQGGQTLAHEIGHALGGLLEGPKHGEHVDSLGQWNLMNGDPIIAQLHTSLRREQIAAFKGSRFIT